MIPYRYLLRMMGDRRLQKWHLVVFRVIAEECDPSRWDRAPYVPIKMRVLCQRTGYKRPNVITAVNRLVHLGYLARGPEAGPPGRQTRTFRLAEPGEDGQVYPAIPLPAA